METLLYAGTEDGVVVLRWDGGTSLAVHPCDPEWVCYAGDVERRCSRLFVSADGGQSWTAAGPELPKVWRLKVAGPDWLRRSHG